MKPPTMLLWTIAWFALGLLLAYEDTVLNAELWILLGGVYLLYAVVGVILFLVMVAKADRKNERRSLVPWSLPALGAVLWFASPYVTSFADDRRFTVAQPEYDAIVAAIRSRNFPPVRRSKGVRYEVDPNLRMVAFPQPGGLIDNWVGIVWDPSHRVATARGFDKDAFTADPAVRGAFGGDLVWCRHLIKDYYRCGFT